MPPPVHFGRLRLVIQAHSLLVTFIGSAERSRRQGHRFTVLNLEHRMGVDGTDLHAVGRERVVFVLP